MRKLTYFLAALVTLVALLAAVFLLRNYEMEAAVRLLKDGDGVAAAEKFKLLATLGDQKAQFLLGSMYAYGWGISKSDERAIYWFGRARMGAEPGVDAAAPAELGVAKSYATGTDGVEVDSTESMKWLRLAARGGSKEAASMLAKSRQ